MTGASATGLRGGYADAIWFLGRDGFPCLKVDVMTTMTERHPRSRRPTILKLQREYLETGDPETLERFYRDLVNVGLKIALAKKKDDDDDPIVIYDIASNVVVRLMEKQTPIIKCAPSAYLKQALYFYGKGSTIGCIEDCDDIISPEDSESFDDYVDSLIDELGIDTTTEMGTLVELTLRSRVSYKKVMNKLDSLSRAEYERMMMEIYEHEKKNLQGNGMSEVRT